MVQIPASTLHDAYAADYDEQVRAYDCHIADLLFGLCYEWIQPGQALLDAGTGSGLSAQLFARAGLQVSGFDFSPAMLEICQAKGFAASLVQHDIQQTPWPYPSGQFDLLVCCGVLHFIPDLEAIFSEAGRMVREGGLFAFTTKQTAGVEITAGKYIQQSTGGFEIYAHSLAYIRALLDTNAFQPRKTQKCFVGEEIFTLWVVQPARP